MLLARREKRAKESIERLNKSAKETNAVNAPCERLEADWDSLSIEAARKARSREVAYIKGFLESRTFRAKDLCTALHLS
eukprot:2301749-Pleurochrysis_carterae.AAC.1